MIRYENDCVGCPQGCINCGRKNDVAHFYCDDCGNEFDPDELYDFDGDMVCIDCLLSNFNTIAQNLDEWGD